MAVTALYCQQLIFTFRRLTSDPLLLNFSLNKNEPLACRPEAALNGLFRTKMDVLVLGHCFLSRDPDSTENRAV